MAIAVAGTSALLWTGSGRCSSGSQKQQGATDPTEEDSRTRHDIDQLKAQLRHLSRQLAGLLSSRLEQEGLKTPATATPDPRVHPASEALPQDELDESSSGPEGTLRQQEANTILAENEGAAWQAMTAVDRVSYLAKAYDEALEQEPPDPGWSRSTELDIADSLSLRELGAPNVRWLECRSTICRAGLSFGSVEDRESFFREAPSTGPWASLGPGFMKAESWEDTEVEVYVVRRGHQLPDVSPPASETEDLLP